MYSEPTPQDMAIARRRVDSSVCAFGGNLNGEKRASDSKNLERKGIFRDKETTKGQSSATVTPSSSSGSPARSAGQTRARMKYEEELPGRYYENESRLSWEFEEAPPVEISREEDNIVNGESHQFDSTDGGVGRDSKGLDMDRFDKSANDLDDSSEKGQSGGSPQPKMRYRCKLCGQPKQNHTCPYQQSLARSIGVNVYPTVNAFAAAEPGSITPALSEMNNFVDVQRETSSNESSPSRPTPDRMRRSTAASTPSNQVTPDSMRSSPRQAHSPSSMGPASLSGRTPTRANGMGRRSGKKRSRSQVNGPADEQPEQFRTVTPLQSPPAADAYTYPALPLPYAQRKKLSDNLFSLSNDVPKLTDECAQVLREAREKDMWDLAVAELMTQVVVVIHCPDGDHRFEGLRQYLLTLGIAC
jgi:hypothetical protein